MDDGSRQAANGNTLSPATTWQFTGSSSVIIMPAGGVMRQGKHGRAGIYPPRQGGVVAVNVGVALGHLHRVLAGPRSGNILSRFRHDPAGLRYMVVSARPDHAAPFAPFAPFASAMVASADVFAWPCEPGHARRARFFRGVR